MDDGRFDKRDSNWWYTDRGGLWGDFPYLHLGERRWDWAAGRSRAVLHHQPRHRRAQAYGLSDQAYPVEAMTAMLAEAGFARVTVHPAWDQLALKDSPEWVVYVAEA